MTTQSTWLESLFSYQGRRVLVTGASRGIGQALALGFARAGAELVVTARRDEALAETAEGIRALGGQVETLACDQTDVDAIRRTIGGLGPVDVLVNNAGMEEVCPSLDVAEALWDRIVDTNLKGAFFTAQVVAAAMVDRSPPGGAIINLASLTSYVGVPTATPYGASKTGILGITRSLAAEWGGRGVRVNAIAPGYFQTELTQAFYDDKAWVDSMAAKVPLGRLGKLDDLVGACLFLGGPAAAYVTGQCLAIDGGTLASI